MSTDPGRRALVGAKTKIVVTLGPATQSPEMIRALVEAGVDVFRLNFSHGTHAVHTETLGHIRHVTEELDEPAAVMQDLCGPKIRVGDLPPAGVAWHEGQTVAIRRDAADPPDITTTYARFVDDVEPGQRVLVDDGRIVLGAERKDADAVHCRVTVGGTVLARKGVNLPDSTISSPSLTDKDVADLAWGIEHGVDYVALSFVRSPDDVRDLRQRLDAAGSGAHVVAKIEKPEALVVIDAIIDATDAVMVARGDLGVELEASEVPFVQKDLIARCHAAGVPVITATQMLDSMIDRPMPTRAEVSDVANAILDGTDAVMLSGETAVGKYPVEAVRVMDRIADQTESRMTGHSTVAQRTRTSPEREALCHGTVHIAEELGAKLILVGSRHGKTALAVSKKRSDVLTLAVTHSADVIRRMCLYWGVVPLVASRETEPDEMLAEAVAWARARGLVSAGDHVVFLASADWQSSPAGAILLHRVGD